MTIPTPQAFVILAENPVAAADAALARDQGDADGFERNVIAFRVDPRLMPGYHHAPVTREEHEQHEESERKARAAWPRVRAVDEAIRGQAPAGIVAVWRLHKPVGDSYPKCEGCDPGMGAEDAAEWPCATATMIARQGDYTLPDHYHLRAEPKPEPTPAERAKALVHPNVARTRQYRGANSPLRHERIRAAMVRFRPGQPLSWKDGS